MNTRLVMPLPMQAFQTEGTPCHTPFSIQWGKQVHTERNINANTQFMQASKVASTVTT